MSLSQFEAEVSPAFQRIDCSRIGFTPMVSVRSHPAATRKPLQLDCSDSEARTEPRAHDPFK